MASYHQMGHDSRNLLDEADLVAYRGAILSPVNEPQARMVEFLAGLASLPDFETLFDPQLYYPNTQRDTLRQWPYFPQDVETADTASDAWWNALTDRLVDVCVDLGVRTVASPVQVPGAFTNGFYSSCVQNARHLHERLEKTTPRIRGMQTAVMSLPDLTQSDRPMATASILSQTPFDRIYIVFTGGVEPRREITNTDQLKGAMRFIAALKDAGLRVLVGYTSTDVLLWKAAGAHDCASGKFFNLRRFTDARFDDPTGGGGQLPYLIEESLVAFLRDSDVLHVDEQGMLSEATLQNPYYAPIRDAITDGSAWLALSWRFYLYWFAEVQDRIETGLLDVRAHLREAEQRWLELEDADVLMEEPRNDGKWLRAWRRALAEYQR